MARIGGPGGSHPPRTLLMQIYSVRTDKSFVRSQLDLISWIGHTLKGITFVKGSALILKFKSALLDIEAIKIVLDLIFKLINA